MTKCGFFNSVDEDRLYNADDISLFFNHLFTDGVMSLPEDALQVTAGSGLSVHVAPGIGMIQSRYLYNTGIEDIELAPAHDTYPRIDRIVMRLDLTASGRLISLAALTGTASAQPTAPELTRTSSVWELSLAQVGVHQNATAVSDVLDERLDDAVCGLVKAKFAVKAEGGTGDYIPHGMIIPIINGNAGEGGINGSYRTISESEEAHV